MWREVIEGEVSKRVGMKMAGKVGTELNRIESNRIEKYLWSVGGVWTEDSL